MKEIIKMIRNMAMVFLHGLTTEYIIIFILSNKRCIKEIGKMVNSTE